MAIVSESPQSHCYDIKSADLSLLALVLKTTDIQAISQALAQQLAESPGFFEQDPGYPQLGLDQQSCSFWRDTQKAPPHTRSPIAQVVVTIQ